MKSKFLGRVGLVLLLFCSALILGVTARAQETADIVGTVTDASGAVVPGAAVTLTNVGTSVTQATTSNEGGNYVFNLLQVGTYSVKVEAKGFKAFSATAIAISSGDRARVDAKLEVGDVAQTVEVSGNVAPALQTDSSQVGALVPAQSVEDLPLNGRNLIKLVQLTPGVTEGSPGSIIQGNRPDDRRQTSSFSANGQTDTMNNNMIDGLDNNERIIGTIGVRPSIDAVQEVNVQTNKYDASVGRTGGAVVDVITKSGTNNFHGTGYEFLRNKVLNTNPNYAFSGTSAPNPAFRQNQYGGSIGGPIQKNKTFFFGDYEKLDYATGTTAALYTVPTECERGLIACPDGLTQFGDFSDSPAISKPGGSAGCLATAGADPTLQYGSATCPFVVVPSGSITPLGRAYFNMYPLPTCGPGTGKTCTQGPASGIGAGIINNYTSAPVKTFASNTWDIRVDHHFSDKNTFYARFTHNGETTINPNGFPAVHIDPATGNISSSGLLVNPVVLQYAGPNNETQEHFAASFVHVYNANLVLNLKAAVFRSNIDSEPINGGTDISNKLWGFCTATSCVNAEHLTPGIVGSGLATVAYTSVNGGNVLSNIGDTSFIPLLEFDTSFQYFAGLTWNHGAHSVRFGATLIRRRATIGQSNNPQGTFTFTGAYTGLAPADLLEGLNLTQARNNSLDQPGFRTWEPGIYAQDDWRARPWLTLNLGIRYDIFTPYTEVHGRISNYNPYLGLVVSPALPGLQQSGPTAGVPTPMRDVAPRFGFAATLPRNTVLRGGFGLTFFPVNYESPYYMKNAPFGYTSSCTNQIKAGTATPCAAPFASGVVSNYGLAASNNNTTVGFAGGAAMATGLPVPTLNIALATNTANYAKNGTIASIPVNLQENYLEQFNLDLQKQFGANVVNIGYVGQIGRHVAPLNSATNQNLPANPTENTAITLPMTVGGATQDFGQLPGFAYFNSTSTGASEEANIGTSFYNALQASFVRRFSKGLTVNFNYVWSHMLDNVDGSRACVLSVFAAPEPCWYDRSNGAGTGISNSAVSNCSAAGIASCQNIYGWQHADWGNGTQDVHDRFSWGVNYELPFAKSATGVEKAVIGGWAVNGSGSWQTGLPFNVTPATSTTGISGGGYLDQTCSGRLANGTLTDWFNYNCFNHPQANTLGKMDPNQVFGPPQRRLDVSLFKTFAIRENVKMEFRTEVFNLFNSPNFNVPAGTSIAYNVVGGVTQNNSVNPTGTATAAGKITAMNGNWNQREIQFALKLIF